MRAAKSGTRRNWTGHIGTAVLSQASSCSNMQRPSGGLRVSHFEGGPAAGGPVALWNAIRCRTGTRQANRLLSCALGAAIA